MVIQSLVLIAIGVIYMCRPSVFQEALWRETCISQRLLTPEQNEIYMWVLGAVSVLIGVVLLNNGKFPDMLQ